MKRYLKPKGIYSLISSASKIKPPERKENVYYIELKKIKPRKEKKEIDKSKLEELADSIRKYGIQQPILVSKIERKRKGGIDVFYRLISGQKRFYAAKLAGLASLPSIIKEEGGNDKKEEEFKKLEDTLTKMLRAKVIINDLNKNQGKISIQFTSFKEMKRIVKKILKK